MKIDTTRFGIAAAATFGIVWILCSFLVWVAPSMTMDVTGHMMHGDWSAMGWHISLTGVLIGLVAWSALAGVCGWLLASIYNFLL